jgi:SAM-dependent methyltransferase
MLSWHRSQRKNVVDPRVPKPTLNYNIASEIRYSDYVESFSTDACVRELPALLDIAGYHEDSERFSIFDYGCGLGRLAFAFTERFGARASRTYFGYEVHQGAYSFLVNAYAAYPNVQFLTDQITLSESYVELDRGESRGAEAPHRISPSAIDISSQLTGQIDVQFSHSVFTHMRTGPIKHVLSEALLLLNDGGVCINTWLVIDDFAEYALASGLADRVLPYEIDGFRTYSTTNPLVCSAYPIDAIEKIYKEAGHQVIDIRFGAWSGREPTQTFTYQDVIVSRPL